MSDKSTRQQNQESHFQTLDGLRRIFSRLKESGYTYVEIGAMGGISGGLAWSIINKGYEPKSPQIRKRLNLPPLMVEAPPCNNPDCPGFGKPHTYDCRTEQVRPKRTAAPKRKRTPYKKINPEDPAQVARQIAKYMPGYELKRKGK